MISALDKYRVHQPIVFVNEVKDYLAKKLTVKSSEYLNVDPDR